MACPPSPRQHRPLPDAGSSRHERLGHPRASPRTTYLCIVLVLARCRGRPSHHHAGRRTTGMQWRTRPRSAPVFPTHRAEDARARALCRPRWRARSRPPCRSSEGGGACCGRQRHRFLRQRWRAVMCVAHVGPRRTRGLSQRGLSFFDRHGHARCRSAATPHFSSQRPFRRQGCARAVWRPRTTATPTTLCAGQPG